ncbi:MAG: RNA polymerase sigma factor [Dermatophilaceae bacterium]
MTSHPDATPGDARSSDLRSDLSDVYAAGYPRLVAQLVAVTGSKAEAEDVVQEAFVRAAQRWDVVGGHDAPEAWVRRVALNLALNHLRRMRRASSAILHWGHELGPGVADSPALGSAERMEVVTALQRLPSRYRVVLALHYLADLDVRAIAAELDLASGTVKTRLARGRARLKELLDAAEGDPPALGDGRSPSREGRVARLDDIRSTRAPVGVARRHALRLEPRRGSA